MLKRVLLTRATRAPLWALAAGGVVATTSLVSAKIYNDATPATHLPSKLPKLPTKQSEPTEELKAHTWGSNSYRTLDLASSEPTSLRTPTEAAFLSGRAFRDVALHEKHAAFVDARGDLYQWGSALGDGLNPICTLKGKDIRSITMSEGRVFALSASGKVYGLPVSLPSGEESAPPTTSWLTSIIWGEPPSKFEIKADTDLSRHEKFVALSAGKDHLLAVTSSGKTFAHPVTANGNSHGQLAMRKIRAIDSTNPTGPLIVTELVPKIQLDPFATTTPFIRPRADAAPNDKIEEEMANLLYEIPALKGVQVSKAVANDRSSYVITKEQGRVLAWGANEYGQLGLGSTLTLSCVFVPTEVALARSYPSGTSVKCTDIASGGDLAYFTVEASQITQKPVVDVLACGMGQWGALGNGSFTQSQGTPVKVKTISGNNAFNETLGAIEPIRPRTLSVSPSGHVLVALGTIGGRGDDLLSWGANTQYQLGTGKRGSSALPMYMKPFGSDALIDENESTGRMMLRTGIVKVLKDYNGKGVGKNVAVQEWPVAGWNSSAVYWRVMA